MRQRFYINGKLEKSVGPKSAETLRKWLDNIERDWSKNGLFPLTKPGEFDHNNAHQVTRVSLDELIVVNTKGNTLRWINV